MSSRVDSETEELLALLDDEYARTIILETYDEAQSAESLSAACDADPSTIYRRIDRLQERGLLVDQQRLDPNGHHYKVYVARLEGVAIDVTEDGFDVDVDYAEEEPADTFTRLYEEFTG
ncbi:helix-turn-helix domain-containing protein [Natrialba swarupiae]|uniref:Helix-turn-helix transcriptional regulator n=1 Tax=Natrialba swarupiae TaxID=2448032 RepID=A0A5D5AWJ3_9EURY|nr:helix-turn-helix domain-containing protein [Natrialba swarupiae]MCW8173218.1 ArsR family transcriptional regulator [Natrialba swarupiae]TYT64030.1 helix-turn-helix transcriptional regulator [Natrialba swarupiae]